MQVRLTGFIALLFLSCPLAAATASPSVQIYETRFNVPANGKSDLSRLKGKVAVVSFWAAWCPACAKEVPTLVANYRKYGERGVEFVGVAMEDDPKVVQDFVSRFSVEYPVVYGDLEAAHLMKKLGNWVAWLPYTLVLDRSGKIHAKVRGAMSAAELEHAVESALSASPP